MRTASASQPDHLARRARLLRRLAPLAGLAAAAGSFGLHHTDPLDGHELRVTLLIVAATAAIAYLFVAVARSSERRLPTVIALSRGSSEVRALTRGDLDFCTVLHAETLPHGFFAELGHPFLRAYLETFVSSPQGVALLLTANDAPVGMVVGVLNVRAHVRWVFRHRGARLALLGVMALAIRPRLALRFARTRLARYRRAWSRRNAATVAEQPAGQPAVLSHVAVVPGAQRAGFGAQLVGAFVEAAREAGSSRVVLTTLAGETGAAGFYRRQGWIELGPHLDFDGQAALGFSLPLLPEGR